MRAWPAVAWMRPASTGLTPLVGREQEIGLLLERWAQVKDGMGQVVLLSGEAGIGKSRLVQVLTEQVASEPQAWLTPCQCSPYYQNTRPYPHDRSAGAGGAALRARRSPRRRSSANWRGFWCSIGLPLAEAVPLFAALLSLPLGADYAPLTVSPEQQKQKTLQALLTHPARASPRSSPCSSSWKTCTGSTPRRWSCSASWSIKVPPPASWCCSPFAPTSTHPGRGARTSPR